jgi:cell division protein FtsW
MLRYSSIALCFAVTALVALGLVMLASTSAWVPRHEPYHFLERQVQMVVLGVVAAIGAVYVSPELLRRFWPWMLAATCVLLALCFMPGVGVEIYGSKRWVNLGFLEFQPSEPAKIVTIIALAAWFARWQTEVKTFWRGFVIPGMLAGTPILLIAAETDVGTALSLSVTVGAVLFCVGTRLRFTVPTALLVASLAVWFVMNDANRFTRIEAWMDLEAHQLGKGQQQWRSLLALGNGGPWGVGLGNGLEKFGNLTFAHIDFIFPVIGEELGLPFTLGVVVCYVLIAIGGVGIAVQANTVFNRCLALGLTCLIVVPAMVNIGVTTAVLPNDGLPLPFVSYGGTSLVFSLAAVGLLVGIHRRTRVIEAREFPLGRETRLAVRL